MYILAKREVRCPTQYDHLLDPSSRVSRRYISRSALLTAKTARIIGRMLCSAPTFAWRSGGLGTGSFPDRFG
jgi:hypothetical protein